MSRIQRYNASNERPPAVLMIALLLVAVYSLSSPPRVFLLPGVTAASPNTNNNNNNNRQSQRNRFRQSEATPSPGTSPAARFQVESNLQSPSPFLSTIHRNGFSADGYFDETLLLAGAKNKELEDVRGGAMTGSVNKAKGITPQEQQQVMSSSSRSNIPTTMNSRQNNPKTVRWVLSSVAAVLLSVSAYSNRETLLPLLDKHYIQERALSILRDLEQRPGSLYLYVFGMAAWELLGLSTIPVETAAAMVFGGKRGFLASGGGKLLGAATAFAVGRFALSHTVHAKLNENAVWKTLNKSTTIHSPLKVALLMKFSCFPELIKNFGSSCLEEISFATYLAATAFHGLMFTAVWTFLGVDTAQRLAAAPELLPINYALQASLLLAAVAGLVVSPLLMAWWIRDMKRRGPEGDNHMQMSAAKK